MSDIRVEVSPYGGSDVYACMTEMIAVATRINIDVWCTMNGIRVLACPYDNRELLHKAWDQALTLKRDIVSTGGRVIDAPLSAQD